MQALKRALGLAPELPRNQRTFALAQCESSGGEGTDEEDDVVVSPSRDPPEGGVEVQRCWVQQWLSEKATHTDVQRILFAVAVERKQEWAKFTALQAQASASPPLSARSNFMNSNSSISESCHIPEIDRMRADTAGIPMLQFSCAKYFCIEGEPSISVSVIRVGPVAKTSRVRYRTRDGTATAGAAYKHAEGTITWERGEVERTISITLFDDEEWTGLVEFRVLLEEEGMENGILSASMKETRVQRIEDDTFPSKRYADILTSGRMHEVDIFVLAADYAKAIVADPVVKAGSAKYVLKGCLKVAFSFVKLFSSAYMLDHVLLPTDEETRGSRITMLICLTSLMVAQLAMAHYLDKASFSWGVTGRQRLRLSNALMNSFLYMDQTSRQSVDRGALVEVMLRDTDVVIKAGYIKMFTVVELVVRIVMCLTFQVVVSLTTAKAGTTGHMMLRLLPVASFPGVVLLTMKARQRTTLDHHHKMQEHRDAFVSNVHDVVVNFRLARDFGVRQGIMDDHIINAQNFGSASKAHSESMCNTKNLMKWYTCIVIASYVLAHGMEVIRGSMRLGVFLTCLATIRQVGGLVVSLQNALVGIVSTAPALCRIVCVINSPSDMKLRMAWSRRQHAVSRELSKAILEEDASLCHVPLVDFTHIRIQRIGVDLQTHLAGMDDPGALRTTKMHFESLVIQQGQLVSLIGPRGHGKSTLLRLFGGVVLPVLQDEEASEFFIPSQLRVLHVPEEALFVSGSLYENLVFGVTPGDLDGSVKRVRAICRRLELPEDLIHSIKDDKTTHHAKWADVVSSSERHMLSFARAIIANPEVLCIHKPTLHIGDHASLAVVDMLREFVDQRGVALDPETRHLRRPRTCIITSARSTSMWKSDKVFKVQGFVGGDGHMCTAASEEQMLMESIIEIPPEEAFKHDPES